MQIEPGYQLHITSWENDADSYITKIFSGLSKEDVRFYIELASNFRSRSICGGWGNKVVPDEVLIACVQTAVTNHPEISDSTRSRWVEFEDDEVDDIDTEELACLIYETLCDYVLGYPQNECYQDGHFCRVFDRVKVIYIPTVCEDVTHQFISTN